METFMIKDELALSIPFPNVAEEERQLLDMINPFFKTKLIPKPDKAINMLWMDGEVRKQERVPHPFPSQRKNNWAGCYVMLDDRFSFDRLSVSPFVIYAGMAGNLGIRISQHWNPTNQTTHSCFNGYWERLEGGLFGEPGEEGTPAGCPICAIWLIADKKARREFEHLLIGVLKPVMNVL